MRHNSREYVGLSMNIPIFNRRASRNNIRSAQLSARSQRLALTEAELALRKEIEQAWYNADAAYSKYRSAGVALASAKVAFATNSGRRNPGRSTIFDFNDAKTRMEKSRVGTRARQNTDSYSVRKYWFLPRKTAETVIRRNLNIVHKQIGAAVIDRPDAVRITNP